MYRIAEARQIRLAGDFLLSGLGVDERRDEQQKANYTADDKVTIQRENLRSDRKQKIELEFDAV